MEKIALIMNPGTRDMVINQKTIDRLSKIGEVVINEGGNNIESVKPLLKDATVCVTSWGSTPLAELCGLWGTKKRWALFVKE